MLDLCANCPKIHWSGFSDQSETGPEVARSADGRTMLQGQAARPPPNCPAWMNYHCK